MSDLSLIPLQDGFETQLSQDWDGNTGTIYVLATPSYTPTTTNTYIVVNPGKTNMQIAEITDYDITAKTLTVSSISFEKGLGISSTAQSHSTGSKVIISDNYQFWEDIQTAVNSKLDDTGGTMTGGLDFTGTTHAGLKVISLTTTQRDALTPANGNIIYNSTAGEFQIYQGGAWSTIASGSTQPNASATVAGKVEIATSAESIAGTDTGGTGALLSALPSDIAKNTQSGTFVYGTDVGGDDTYVVALVPVLAAYTSGQTLYFKPTTANTGACSVDFGPGVLNIKTKDGNDPQTGVLRALTEVSGHYDGTNFVIDNEDFATTSNKGIAEMATDAEVVTGTDETRYVNPKQLKDNTSMSLGVGNALGTKDFWNFSIPFLFSTDVPTNNFWTVTGSITASDGFSYKRIINGADATGSFMTKGSIFTPFTSSTLDFGTTKKVIVEFGLACRAVGTEQQGFGLAPTNAPFIDYDDASVDSACFTISAAGALYGHTSNGSGTTNHTETEITGITLTNANTYRIEFDPGVDVKFYVNGVLKATNTTTLPNSNTILFGYGFQGNSNNNDEMYISNPYFSIEK